MISRRQFTQAFAATVATASLAGCSSAPASVPVAAGTGAGKNTTLGPVKQIDAGLLNIGCAEAGPADGPVAILVHGWPYDIHSYVDVAPALAASGYRVIVPYLRGYGTTTFLSKDTFRNGQQAAVASDIIAALSPERCKAAVLVSGYLITSLEANLKPLPPAAELGWWYQYYFSTERGVLGYTENRHDFNKLIWKIVSPKWNFDDATYERTATSFTNPDHVSVVIHNYRWRLSLAKGEPQYDELEKKLAGAPVITVPTITIGSDFDGAAADGAAYRAKFSGRYEHRIFRGIGHNVPQEAPRDFVTAVVDADHL